MICLFDETSEFCLTDLYWNKMSLSNEMTPVKLLSAEDAQMKHRSADTFNREIRVDWKTTLYMIFQG